MKPPSPRMSDAGANDVALFTGPSAEQVMRAAAASQIPRRIEPPVRRYDGRINGRMTQATARALRRFRDDFDFKAEDVSQDWALHALLWRQCRDEWTRAGGSLDRFGLPGIMATRPASVQALRRNRKLHPRAGMPRFRPIPQRQRHRGTGWARVSVCLPSCAEILGRSAGRPSISRCASHHACRCRPKWTATTRSPMRSAWASIGVNPASHSSAICSSMTSPGSRRPATLQFCADPRRLMRVRPTATGAVSVDGLRVRAPCSDATYA